MKTAAKGRGIPWVLLLLGVLIIFGSVYYFYQKKQRSLQEVYQEVQVERGNLQLTILTTGTVQPENRLEIKSPITGRVDEILVKEGEKVRKGQVLAWMSSTERAALLDAARSKGEKELKRWQDLYRPTPVISPIHGMVILKNVEPGQSFTNTDPLIVLSDRLTVKAQVDEVDLASIRKGQKAQITLDAYPQAVIGAEVTAIAYEATVVNNVTTYSVNVTPSEPPEMMRSGMTANITFFLQAKENILLIPNSAIQFSAQKTLVFKQTERGKEQVLIKTGLTDGKMSEVVEGLEEGDKIFIKNLPQLGKDKDQRRNPFGGRSR